MAKKVKNDVHTKFILTVIAICLVWVCVRDINFLPRVYASDQDELVNVRVRAVTITPGESWDPVSLDLPDSFSVIVKNSSYFFSCMAYLKA